MALANIKNLMAEMKFRGMLYQVDSILDQATKESWSYSDLLDAIMQAELDWKKEKRVEAKIKTSKLKLKPELEDFDFTAKRNITQKQIKELYSLKWIKQGRPILLIGQTGVGKTFLAQALGLHACRSNYAVLFNDLTTFIENLSMARSSNSYLKFKERMASPALLILDDFGLRKFTTTEAQDLCEIIEARSIEKSTIITTQLPVDHWSEVIPDPVIADAIIDRIIHSSITINIKGDSYRKVKAQKLDKQEVIQ